ncbi:hypothetical protein JAAARDRAFT_173758 [Jaapia argillacea MUCL 33604]|uniref:Cytosine-specific methyltransferase n=1 Tax=Jaapia argillacea MUCL 33604 TaxID=933084 RepID=A0A067QCE2_9AGAM|nr:hypothetical protein JAAARDRAFT_173758 [Jaapia argillacea MUCL 33604]
MEPSRQAPKRTCRSGCGTQLQAVESPSKRRKVGPTAQRISRGRPQPSLTTRSNTANDVTDSSSDGEGGDSRPSTSKSTPTISRNSVTHNPKSVYKASNDELIEDENLQIIGEIAPVNEDEDASLPVRELSDFTIYDSGSHRFVSVYELQTNNLDEADFRASGLVTAHADEEDEDDDEDEEDEETDSNSSPPQRVCLSRIVKFNIYHVYGRGQKAQLDCDVWIGTEFAWYLLRVPSRPYCPLYKDFYLRHQMLCLLVSAAIEDPKATYEDFILTLEGDPEFVDPDGLMEKVLGRIPSKADVDCDETRNQLAGLVLELNERQVGLKLILANSPLLNYILPERSAAPGRAIASDRHTLKNTRKKSGKSVETATVITPTIKKIAEPFFLQRLAAAGEIDGVSRVDEARIVKRTPKIHRGNHKSVVWLENEMAPLEDAQYFTSVRIDGVTYSVYDSVAMLPGEDDDKNRRKNATTDAARSKNAFANSMWFGRIRYFFEDDDGMQFHVQWYQHGSQTLLQELAHVNSLFLIDECQDLPLDSIYSKVYVRELDANEVEPLDEEPSSTHFFCNFRWRKEDSSFIYRDENLDPAIDLCEPHKPCGSCARKLWSEQLEKSSQDYHIHDFIYLPGSSLDGPYQIAQITQVKPTLSVRLLGRYDDVIQTMAERDGNICADERRLLWTSTKKNVNPEEIQGRCHVIHPSHPDFSSFSLDQWCQHHDHFYVQEILASSAIKSPKDLRPLRPQQFKFCEDCHQVRVDAVKSRISFIREGSPLRGLELFSGAGGLSVGLEKSGFVKTEWAVEYSPSAALTYATNHPNATVYNQSVNALLKQTLACHLGEELKPLLSIIGDELPPMPRQGEVEFVYGGPPCQSFSGANHNKRADDLRSSLICNFMSWVDHYRPKYFLLENVLGLLSHRVGGTQDGRRIVDGVKQGMVKFILRAATSLQYQVHVKVLQAGDYGSPQSRQRVIFLGAIRDCRVPEFPIPMYSFPRRSWKSLMATGDEIWPISRNPNDTTSRCAPYRGVTVNDAIGDLPPYDWINPHNILKQTRKEKDDVADRQEQGIDQVEARNSAVVTSGYQQPVDYAYPPRNRYQRDLRAGAGEQVFYHYTRAFAPQIVERVIAIPLTAGADQSSLPQQLRGNDTLRGGQKTYKGMYGRLDGKGYFRTALTDVKPNTSPGGVVLHPSQKRVITVRECARAQGFPDTYRFKSVESQAIGVIADQLRQIGNAVPIPLARALGQSIGESMMLEWEERREEGSVVV